MSSVRRLVLTLSLTLLLPLTGARAQTPRLSTVNITSDEEGVRVIAQGEVYEMRVEVIDDSGEVVFESAQSAGQALDWNMRDAQGRKVAPGTYTVTVSYRTQAGRLRKRVEQVWVGEEVSAVESQPKAEAQETAGPTPTAVGTITGEGAVNRLAKFTGANSIGSSIISENALKIGINTPSPVSKLHILSAANDSPPRLQSTGTTSFTAGWDFYHGTTPKGYVGIPGTGQGLAPGELLLYGSPGVKTSLWAGGARAVNILTNGNVGIGPNATTPTAKLQVSGDGLIGVRSSTSGADAVSGLTTGGGAGVFGKNLIGTGFGVRGESNGATGFGIHARNLNGFALGVEGNAKQNRDKGGLVKAMIFVRASGTIARCYNGQTGASIHGQSGTSNTGCGFTVTHNEGLYGIDFGFQVSDRFIAVTTHTSQLTTIENVAARVVFRQNVNVIAVNTFFTDERDTNVVSDFFLIVF